MVLARCVHSVVMHRVLYKFTSTIDFSYTETQVCWKVIISSVCVLRRLAMERDSVERESREKETKILSLNRQLEELQDRLAESDRVRAQQQRELDSYANNQDDVGKNVQKPFHHFLFDIFILYFFT